MKQYSEFRRQVNFLKSETVSDFGNRLNLSKNLSDVTSEMKKANLAKTKRTRIDGPFARNLKRILTEKNLTISAAAEIAGVSPSVVSAWLTGGQPGNPLAVQKLAIAAGCSMEWLLCGNNASSSNEKGASIAELFDEIPTEFTGIFRISATRLVSKKGGG